MVGETRERLKRGAQREVGSKCVVDIGHTALGRQIRNLFGGPKAADAPAINLNIADAALFHEVLGHEAVMRRFAARGPDRSRASAERPVGV
jgi:hypothetical protein